MSIKDNINNYLINWMAKDGPESDIVLSSRVRLARNLENESYPNFANDDTRRSVSKKVHSAITRQNHLKLHYINMSDLPEIERELLVEKHLISPLHAKGNYEKGLFLNDKESVSIMLNEEDHIRIQVLAAGMQLNDVWEIANEIDDTLESQLDFAFSEKWGYLSTCPTNVGTGLRASIMIHLPALNLRKNINKMLRAVSQLGLAVRGLYGEGSESLANIYQISNQVTLGHSETDIIDNLGSVSKQIIEQEKQARKILLEENEVNLKDTVRRSLGTLKYAYRISSEEAMKLLSNVKLGIDLGIIEGVDNKILRELMILIRPAHIQKLNGKELESIDRDIKRSELIQARLEMK
ncbi:protein arginine kinase [Natronospora cellulosivora (SeqCode)]